MINVTVTCRANPEDELPPFDVQGITLYPGCPLAVTPCPVRRGGKWTTSETFCITHIPTGYNLKCAEWPTAAAALAVVAKCDPMFPAWPLANGDNDDDTATIACHAKFKAAMASAA